MKIDILFREKIDILHLSTVYPFMKFQNRPFGRNKTGAAARVPLRAKFQILPSQLRQTPAGVTQSFLHMILDADCQQSHTIPQIIYMNTCRNAQLNPVAEYNLVYCFTVLAFSLPYDASLVDIEHLWWQY